MKVMYKICFTFILLATGIGYACGEQCCDFFGCWYCAATYSCEYDDYGDGSCEYDPSCTGSTSTSTSISYNCNDVGGSYFCTYTSCSYWDSCYESSIYTCTGSQHCCYGTCSAPTTITTTTVPQCTVDSQCCGSCTGNEKCANCLSGICYCFVCPCLSGEYECSPCATTSTTTTTTIPWCGTGSGQLCQGYDSAACSNTYTICNGYPTCSGSYCQYSCNSYSYNNNGFGCSSSAPYCFCFDQDYCYPDCTGRCSYGGCAECSQDSHCTGTTCGSNGLTYGERCSSGNCVVDVNNYWCEDTCCNSECMNDQSVPGSCSGNSCECETCVAGGGDCSGGKTCCDPFQCCPNNICTISCITTSSTTTTSTTSTTTTTVPWCGTGSGQLCQGYDSAACSNTDTICNGYPTCSGSYCQYSCNSYSYNNNGFGCSASTPYCFCFDQDYCYPDCTGRCVSYGCAECSQDSHCTDTHCMANGQTCGERCSSGNCVVDVNNCWCEDTCCNSECMNDYGEPGSCSGSSCECETCVAGGGDCSGGKTCCDPFQCCPNNICGISCASDTCGTGVNQICEGYDSWSCESSSYSPSAYQCYADTCRYNFYATGNTNNIGCDDPTPQCVCNMEEQCPLCDSQCTASGCQEAVCGTGAGQLCEGYTRTFCAPAAYTPPTHECSESLDTCRYNFYATGNVNNIGCGDPTPQCVCSNEDPCPDCDSFNCGFNGCTGSCTSDDECTDCQECFIQDGATTGICMEDILKEGDPCSECSIGSCRCHTGLCFAATCEEGCQQEYNADTGSCEVTYCTYEYLPKSYDCITSGSPICCCQNSYTDCTGVTKTANDWCTGSDCDDPKKVYSFCLNGELHSFTCVYVGVWPLRACSADPSSFTVTSCSPLDKWSCKNLAERQWEDHFCSCYGSFPDQANCDAFNPDPIEPCLTDPLEEICQDGECVPFECNGELTQDQADAECRTAGITCAYPLGDDPNKWAECNRPINMCDVCGPCDAPDDCVDINMCCDALIGKSGMCVDKGVDEQYRNWLCDPGIWFECNEENLNKIQEWDVYKYKCIYEDGYKWIDVSENNYIDIVSILSNFVNKIILYFAGFKII